MAAFPNTRTLWTYTSDDGVDIPFRGVTGYTAQAATLGGTAWTGAGGASARRGLKLRCVYAVTAGGVRRKVVIFTAAKYSDIVVNTTTVSVDVGDGQGTSATVRSREGEHHQGGGLTN